MSWRSPGRSSNAAAPDAAAVGARACCGGGVGAAPDARQSNTIAAQEDDNPAPRAARRQASGEANAANSSSRSGKLTEAYPIRSGLSNAAIQSSGYNLADDTSCGLTGTGDRQGSTFNPNLGSPQDNGGPADGAPGFTSPVLTEALPATSIAVDTDPAAANPDTDERHVTRPQGTASDVGAFEFVPVTAALPLAGSHADGWRVQFALMDPPRRRGHHHARDGRPPHPGALGQLARQLTSGN